MSVNFEGIKARHRLSDVVSKVVNLTRDGKEFRGLCPFHKEKTPSFTVVDDRRFFHCFGCGARGDVVDFVRDAYNVDLSTALKMLDGEISRDYAAPKEIAKAAGLYDGMKIGNGTPTSIATLKRLRVYNPKRQRFTTFYPSMVFPYMARDRKTLIGYVVRIELGEGKKVTPMLRWSRVGDEDCWAIWPFDRPRPLYVKPAAGKTRVDQVLIVEGEKAADAAARLLPMMHVVAWPGGGNNAKHADWTRLEGRSLLLWPDADAPGVATMIEIAAITRPIAKTIKVIAWDKTKPEGWDAADAEKEGWSTDAVIEFLRNHASVWTSPAEVTNPSRAATDEASGPSVPPAEPAASEEGDDVSGSPPGLASSPDLLSPSHEPPGPDVDDGEPMPFRMLGHNDGRYFYFPNGSQQVMEISAPQHTTPNLLALYPNIAWWEGRYPQKKEGFNLNLAQTDLLNAQQRVGIFDDARIRGRGAWIDRGRSLINLGDRIVCDGVEYKPTQFDTRFVYEAGAPLAIDVASPATTAEAHKLVELIDRLTWETPLSGNLLAGWIVISMVCGALKWRPHIWITGGAGSGKTTVVEDIVKRMIGTIADEADGTSSEAGVRQAMGYDARPVIGDEFESEGRRAAERVQQMLQLARGASSGMRIKKGSQSGDAITYTMRSCFCFSSINTAVAEHADETRISKLILRQNTSPDREVHFAGIMKTIVELITPAYAAAMFSRTVRYLPTLLKNIDTFGHAAAAHLRNRRAADQIGAMLAGYYLCHSTKEIDFDTAKAWVERRTWSEHTAIESSTDESKLLTRIALIKVRMATMTVGTRDYSVGELIKLCARGNTEEPISLGDAERQLGAMGIRIRALDTHFAIANRSPELSRHLDGTPWAKDWITPLRGIAGAQAIEKTYFSPGFKERGTALPVYLLDETLPAHLQPPPAEAFDGCSDEEIPVS